MNWPTTELTAANHYGDLLISIVEPQKGEREGRCINSRGSNSKGVVPANKLYVARRREKLNHFGRNCCFENDSHLCNIDRGTVRRFLFSKIKRNGGVFHFLFLYSRSFRLYKFV